MTQYEMISRGITHLSTRTRVARVFRWFTAPTRFTSPIEPAGEKRGK